MSMLTGKFGADCREKAGKRTAHGEFISVINNLRKEEMAMGLKVINENPKLLRMWIDTMKQSAEEYYRKNPNCLIPQFEQELRNMGFQFEISSQAMALVPKHKDEIVPLALKYYQRAKELGQYKDQTHFLNYFHVKGLDSILCRCCWKISVQKRKRRIAGLSLTVFMTSARRSILRTISASVQRNDSASLGS